MAGLQLNVGGRASASYAPLTPASAATPSGASTISQMAYGVSGTGTDDDRKVAGYGTVGMGLLSFAALAFIWYSLPR